MASFYDTPAQASFVNTYVPIPFEEIVQAGTARQSRYDDALAVMEQNQSYLESLSAIPGQQQSYLSNAIRNYNQIAEEYAGKDLSNAFIRRQLRDKVRGNINPTVLNNITKSYENYQNAQKQALQLDVAGKYFRPYEETMDPAITGQLSPYEVYNYMPSAFQDPDEMIINRFRSLPVADNTTLEGGKLMRTQSNIDAINQTFDETVRGIKDTPQGEWIIRQAKANGTYTGDDFSTVAAYVESLKPEFTINNRAVTGFAPGYGSNTPQSNIGSQPVYGQGVEEKRGVEFTNARQNRLAIEDIEEKLTYTKNPEERQQLQTMLDGLLSERNRVFTAAGISVNDSDYLETLNTIGTKYNLTPEGFNIIEEIGNELLNSNKTLSAAARIELRNTIGRKLLEINPTPTNSELKNNINLHLNAVEEYYETMKSIIPSKADERKAFKDFGQTTSNTPIVAAPALTYSNGQNRIFNPRIGEYQEAASNTLVKLIRNNPESFAVKAYNQKDKVWEVLDKKSLDAFSSGDAMEFVGLPALPNYSGQQELQFRLKDSNNSTSGSKLYSIVLNDQSQLNALGRDFISAAEYDLDANEIIGIKLMYPEIGSTFMTQFSINPNKQTIALTNSSGGKEEVVVSKNQEGLFVISGTNTDGQPMTLENSPITNQPMRTKEEVVDALYALQLFQ